MLYRPEAFDRLTDEPWDERRVADGIRAIVDDADRTFDPSSLWPAHEWDKWTLPTPLTGLYVGAAGVVWALDVLARRGHAASRIDLPAAALRALERWRATPELPSGVDLASAAESGLFLGETGVLAVAWRLAGGAALTDDLYRRTIDSRASEAVEVMWGAPGALLAARAALDRSGDERWARAWRVVAEAVWAGRDADGLWTQDLYGGRERGLTPPHGLVGNAQALLGGGELLRDDRRCELVADANAVLERTAVLENGLANWPPAEGEPLRAPSGQIRLQWCAGAPGIVTAAAAYLSEELLLAGAELVWRAGPHGPDKGPSTCHGTAGNGYAFLKVFERTGDERWLERARRFAVHALEQVERGRRARGRGRYSLWAGDLGVAVFAADCLEARTAYPILETWD